MNTLKILSWNVNGVRAVQKKGLLPWLAKQSPDILCLQETKAHPNQLDDDLLHPPDYYTYWEHPERKGYSGVATFTKDEPYKTQTGFDIPDLDTEGRVLITDYADFVLMNIYFPNGKKDQFRLEYKLAFYDIFLAYADQLKDKKRKIIVCGDFNSAHKEIDIARPKENEKYSGFLPIERAWLDKFVAHGYVDIFRQLHPEPHQYTWWDMKSGARASNVGWRIDYFFVSENVIGSVTDAFIMPEVLGSDHCPVGITLTV
ncbi:exodeoxyribonuclease III [Chloroflexota bacterium]